MKEYNHDTSADYEDLIDYVAEENILNTLDEFLGDKKPEYKPKVEKKKDSDEYPEPWQNLYVNFPTEQDYIDFMLAIDEKPVPKLNKVVYKVNNKDNGLLDFLEM